MRWIALSTLLFVLGCPNKPTSSDATPSPAAERGRMTYMANCMACHNVDPGKAGTVGPAIKGSTRELVEARVLRAQYPPGYAPKRETKLMIAMPQLADRVDDLAEYLR
jgi:mono/diheme cytochrome c family protein